MIRSYFNILPERQQQVLERLSSGLKHEAIAIELGIGKRTVTTYIQRMRAKNVPGIPPARFQPPRS